MFKHHLQFLAFQGDPWSLNKTPLYSLCMHWNILGHACDKNTVWNHSVFYTRISLFEAVFQVLVEVSSSQEQVCLFHVSIHSLVG